MPEFIDNVQLNDPQKEAVRWTDGPLLVLAGAGTGKTRVLTCRIAYIIKKELSKPSEILAVTFTNKAAKQMIERIEQLDVHTSGMTIGTFHSIAAKILRTHASLLNLTANFTIIDASDQQKLVKNVLEDLNIDVKENPVKLVLNIISRWKDIGLLPDQIGDTDIKSPTHLIAKKVYLQYQQRLLDSNSCDFGDLLLYNNKIFFDYPEVLLSYQQKFKYVLIDEYQDTNPAQYLWARLLAGMHKNICCVGDDDQSIYSWRGAEVGNILKFEKDFLGAKVIKLEQNYRSTTPILAAAASLIRNNTHRHHKTLWTQKLEGDLVKIITCYNDKEEARFVANYIQQQNVKDKLNFNQIAVLVRAGFQTRAFEEIFIAATIPYKIVGGLKFYERAEIKDILSYIRIIINNDDNLAFERIINVPRRAIGPSTLNLLKDIASKNNCSLFRALRIALLDNLLKPKMKATIKLFIDQVNSWQQRYNSNLSPTEVTATVLEEAGYLGIWRQEKTDESKARLDNIQEMLRAISEFDTIEEFIQHTSLVMDNDQNNHEEGEVNVMTLHAAKGLEFDTVFLPGMEEGLFPHQKSLNEESTKGLEEERRIAYVGMTRAKNKLIMSHAENRYMFYEYVRPIPSRFIRELPEDICVKISASKNYYNNPIYNNNYFKGVKGQINNGAVEMNLMKPGCRVKHNSFGTGIIIKKNDDNLEISFENNGIKTVKESFITLLDTK